MASAAEDGNLKVLMREQRKRTSSLGSHGSGLSSPEIALRTIASSSSINDAGATSADARVASSTTAPPAWTGPRSGSAPPERRTRLATLTSDFVPSSERVNGETPLQDQDASSTSVQDVANDAAPAGERADHPKQIDKLLLDGLMVAKDRLLLLRSDLEMEKLANDTARTRMRVAPPGFPPNLNSYQRLLIHRLADMWSMTRELEPASASNSPTPAPSPSAGSMISGTIVLVKTETTKAPSVRIASLAPPSSPDLAVPSAVPTVSLVSKVSELNLDIQNKATASPTLVSMAKPSTIATEEDQVGQLTPNSAASTSSQISVSAASSSSASPAPSLGPVRIMSRAANAAARAGLNKSRSPSAGSSTQGMTFEEREAAYQQARMRIFNESQKTTTTSPSEPQQQTVRPSSMPPPQEYQHQPHQQQAHHVNQYQPEQQQPQPYMQQHQQHFQQQQQLPPMQHVQMNPMPLPAMQMNPALRPSAPVFVYQPPLEGQYQQGQYQQQQQLQPQPRPQPQVAYYPMQPQAESGMHNGPPIQITMSSPAPIHAQQPPVPVAYAAYPMQMPPQSFVPGHAPFSRPTSAHSHSSQSSISTTTSASSIRTASTSSAQRSTLSTSRGYTSPTASLRPMRQTSTHAGPSTRQVRPTTRPSIGGSSTHSNVSTHSRNSQSSSSSPSVAGDSSASAHPASSQTSKSNSSSSSDKDTASKAGQSSEDTALVEPHPVLPARPDWIDSANSSKATSSSASSVSSTSSRERASDLTDEPSSIQRDDAHTPLSSTSGKTSSRGLDEVSRKLDGATDLPVVEEDEAVDARSTPLPHFATLPSEDKNGNLMKFNKSDKLETASQASSSRSSRKHVTTNQPRVIENPPLRYDKQKGWTVLSSSALSQVNQANQNGQTSTNKQWKPPSPAASVASSSNWSQHAFQPSAHYAQPVPVFQNGHVHQAPQGHHPRQQQPQQQQQAQQYVMMPVPMGNTQQGFSPSQALQPQNFGQQQSQGNVHSATSPQAVMMSLPPQQGYQSGPMPYQSQPFAGAPQYNGQQQQMQVFFQPIQHAQAGFQQHQPQQQQFTHFVQTQPFPTHVGGLTPADMMANGEMLYSYDLPRPVPRSGATLFDPNASN